MSMELATEPRLEEYTQSLREDSFVALLHSLGIAGMILLCACLISNSPTSLILPVSIIFLGTYWLANKWEHTMRPPLSALLRLQPSRFGGSENRYRW